MSPSLTVVADKAANGARSETISQRVRRLQAEARDLAREHITALQTGLTSLEALAAEIAEGGEAYPPGVREIARRVADDCESRAQTLQAIAQRG